MYMEGCCSGLFRIVSYVSPDVKPTPLSAYVNSARRTHTITRATLIQAVLEKVHEVKEEQRQETEQFNSPDR